MHPIRTIVPLLTATLLLAACSASGDHPAPDNPFEAQVARGAGIYGSTCARCHGNAGQGTTKAPALVGATALPLHPRADAVRTGDFHTAMDIALFATANMPPDAQVRAGIQEQQYWDVLAFALSANGVVRTEPVGPHNAAAIVLHP